MDNKDFAALTICAIRYCFGRKTYMPELIRGIVRNNIDKIDTQTLKVMEKDCEFQKDMNLYGDELIDKPDWIAWHEYLQAEIQKRRKFK